MTTDRKTAAKLAAVPSSTALTLPDGAKALTDWHKAACEQYRGPGASAALWAFILALVCPVPVNVFLVGFPGTGKTSMAKALARSLALAFLGRTFSPWTDASELLGGVDIKALADGRIERVSSPHRPTLTTADIVLLDEFPRGAQGIKALCMSALSDRETPTGEHVPAHVIIAGANTRLTSEDEKAIADRFALRVDMPRLMNKADLRAVIFRETPIDGKRPTAAPLPALPPSLVEFMRAQANEVNVPGDIADAVVNLVLASRQPPATGTTAYPDASERRLVIASRILQASAALDGRTSVTWSDLTDTMPMILDDGPESRAALKTLITSSVPKWVATLADLDGTIKAAIARARRVGEGKHLDGEGDAHAKVDAEFDAVLDTLKPHGADVLKRGSDKIETARDAVIDAWSEGQKIAREARKAGR